MTINALNRICSWPHVALFAVGFVLVGCGGSDSVEPATPADPSVSAEGQSPDTDERQPRYGDPDFQLTDAVFGNDLYLALGKDGHTVHKSIDGNHWQVAFTIERRTLRELSFEDGSFAARTRKVSFVSSDPLAAIWIRDRAVQGKDNPDTIANSYIVMYDDDAGIDNVEQFTSALERQVNAAGGQMSVKTIYELAGPGFAAEMTEATLEILRQDPSVAYVEQEHALQMIEPDSSQPDEYVAEESFDLLARGSQSAPQSIWNLDRIDQRQLPLNRIYKYPASGKGVHAYVLDSGIRKSHSQFARTKFGPGWSLSPCQYGAHHGTHVAGIIGGKTYGVAKDVTLHNIHASGCTSNGSTVSISVKIIEFIMKDVRRHGRRAVVNMSFASYKRNKRTTALEDAITNATRAGIVFVAAAGNSGNDFQVNKRNACNFSPARSPNVIAVGSYTDHGRQIPGVANRQARSRWSNMGRCITLFAPGERILSADIANNQAIVSKGGTSMAAPHVTGAVAIYLELHPKASVRQVKQALIAASSKNVMRFKDLGAGSPNRLLNIRF